MILEILYRCDQIRDSMPILALHMQKGGIESPHFGCTLDEILKTVYPFQIG